MLKSIWTGAMMLAAMLVPTGVSAGEIQYTVNQSLPEGGITGTITTDGTLGPLAGADIVSWSLTATSYSNSETLTPLNSTVVTGAPDGLSATATAISSDFPDPTFGYLKFAATSPTEGFVDWVVGNIAGTDGYIAANATTDQVADETYEYIYASEVIAADGTPVPEPATWAIFLLGLFGVGFMVRGVRRKDAVGFA